MISKETMYGVSYSLPEVTLLQDTGLGVPELAARTCYDSFSKSENVSIQEVEHNTPTVDMLSDINDIEHSDVLDSLAWVHFHHSVLEHTNVSYLIRGTSRAVLQEHARHRVQGISVRSTRYTMSTLINAFVAAYINNDKEFFFKTILSLDMFVTTDEDYNRIEINTMYNKLLYQTLQIENFYELSVAKSSLQYIAYYDKFSVSELFNSLQKGKKKRNVGDAFKHIITDNVKVDMVVTFNLRSLKNYFGLRDSGAAFFQIRWLAQAMKQVTPDKYLKLIVKDNKDV